MKFSWIRGAMSLCLTLTMITATSVITFAAPGDNALLGELVVSGASTNGTAPAVSLNGEEAVSGRTVLSSSTIATTGATSATVRLKNLGAVSLAPNSILSLSFDNNTISGTLNKGDVRVSNQAGVGVEITTTNGVFTNKTAENGVISVNANGIPKQDDDDDEIEVWPYILIFSGLVATMAYVALSGDENDLPSTVSPVS